MTSTTCDLDAPVAGRLDIDLVIDRIRRVVGSNPVPLHEPRFQGREWDYVKDCIDTGWVSSVGKYVDQFERQLEGLTGAKRAVAVVNGTAALHVCLLLCGVKAGTEVLVPALTFIATANAVSYCGAIPHFVDSDPGTLGLDPAKLAEHLDRIAVRRGGACFNKQTGRQISAVVPMHTFGHPVDMEPLCDLAASWGIAVVEDAAESLGSTWHGRPCGRFGRVAALSFNGNKIITTGGGGAILTDDEELGRLAKHLTTTAKRPHRWAFEHDLIGFNYRLPNINAALGCAQLEQLEGFVASKRALAARYQDALANLPGFRFVAAPEGAESNYWLNAILLDEEEAPRRDEFLARSNDAGIMTRPAWSLMHRLPMYGACPRAELTVAEDLAARLVNIPSSAGLA